MTKRSFQIKMRVPIGERTGILQWEEQEGTLNGMLDIMQHQNPFTGTITPDFQVELAGSITPDFQVELTGNMVTLMREISYTAHGRVIAGQLRMELQEPRHVYQIEGVEIEDA